MDVDEGQQGALVAAEGRLEDRARALSVQQDDHQLNLVQQQQAKRMFPSWLRYWEEKMEELNPWAILEGEGGGDLPGGRGLCSSSCMVCLGGRRRRLQRRASREASADSYGA